jgi:hypothetical protein
LNFGDVPNTFDTILSVSDRKQFRDFELVFIPGRIDFSIEVNFHAPDNTTNDYVALTLHDEFYRFCLCDVIRTNTPRVEMHLSGSLYVVIGMFEVFFCCLFVHRSKELKNKEGKFCYSVEMDATLYSMNEKRVKAMRDRLHGRFKIDIVKYICKHRSNNPIFQRYLPCVYEIE